MGIMDLLGQFGMTGGGEGLTGDYGMNQGGPPPMPMGQPDQGSGDIPMPRPRPGLAIYGDNSPMIADGPMVRPARPGDSVPGIPMPPPRPGGIDGQQGSGIDGPQRMPIDLAQAGPMGGSPPLPPPAGGMPFDQAKAIADQSAVGPALGGAPPTPQAGPPVPLPQPRPPTAPQAEQIPLPPPRPQMPPAGSPALPPGATPAAGAGAPGGQPSIAPLRIPTPPGAPPSPGAPGQPPLPPFAQQPGDRPIPQMQVLRSDDKKMRQFGSGVAAGLANIQGPGKFASFARGAGQGLQGSEKEQQRQEGTEDKQQGTHFNQLSTAFKDMLAAQNSQNAGALNKARADYFAARAKAEGQGSKAWQNTPQGKILNIEKTIDARVDRALKLKAQQWKQNGTPEAQQKAEEQAVRQQMETEKQGLYKQMGINPGDVEKIKTQGMSQQNPFDASKMTPDQFHATVPLDAFYRSQDGKVYQRTQPPPGDKRSDAETAKTDYAAATEEPAMTGANG